MRIAACVVVLLLKCAIVWSEPVHDRMTLIEAIEAVRGEGYRISYSTRLVRRWMRVREAPSAADPLDALRAVLASYNLGLRAGPGGAWLVVAVEPPEPVAVTERRSPELADQGQTDKRPLDEITIVASRHAVYSRSAADQFLTAEDIQQMPHLADDAFRALHRLPGVAASDFQAPFNLRGGAVDEVKLQLNGVELVEPFHMRTLFQPLSIIDPGIIGEAQVLSGGFTAKHGRYMSGVIDISTVQPDSEPVHELGVSFVSAFARSRGTLANGSGSYFISGRRGYLDLLADSIVDEGEELEPRYSDLFAGLRYSVSDSVDLSVETLLTANDVRFLDPGDGEDFGEDSEQRHVWLSATAEFGDGVLSQATVYASDMQSVEDGSQIEGQQAVFRFFDRDVDVLGFKTDWTVPLGRDRVLELGGEYRDLDASFDYRLNSRRRSDFVNNAAPFSLIRDIQAESTGEDYAAYASYRHRVGRFIWELGARWDKQTYVGNVDDSQLSPRFNAYYELSQNSELRVAWGDFQQAHAIQNLAVPDGDLNYYDPERAEHRIIGLRQRFSNEIDLQADIYQKLYRDLRPRYENLLDIYEFAPESNFDRARIDPTEGEAYGAEITLRRDRPEGLAWWVNYTWAKVTDTIEGASVRRSWDQRSAVTGNLSWRGERWSVNVVARYHSGWPRTPLLVSPVLDANDNIVGIVSDLSRRNSADFDDYSRVDLRVSRRVPLTQGSFEYYFEIFNLFDSNNQCCTSNHSLSTAQGLSVAPEFDEFLPFFPSFGFVWRFGPGANDI